MFRDLSRLEESEGVAAEDRSLMLPGAAGGRPALLVHGTPGTPAEMAPLARALIERGFSVSAPLLPGHGRGAKALGETRWEDCLAHVERCWRVLGGRPASSEAGPGVAADTGAVLVGYSFGGFLALLLAAEQPPAALVTLAAYVFPRTGMKHRVLKPLVRLRAGMGPCIWRWKLQLAGLTPHALAALPRIACRALVIHGDEDRVVSPESARAIYRGLASWEKELRILPGRNHLLLSGGEGVPLLREVAEYLGSPAEGRGREEV